MQTKLRTNELEPNENISFPIGTIFLVDKLYEVLNFCNIFGKHKTRGIDINNLLRALISYKLTDNFSIKRSHDWINRPEVLAEFSPNKGEGLPLPALLGTGRDTFASSGSSLPLPYMGDR